MNNLAQIIAKRSCDQLIAYLRDQNIALTDPRVAPLQAQGKTVVFVLVDGKLKGAIALAAGAIYTWGVVLTPAVGAVLMSASTVIVAINARLLRLKKSPGAEEGEEELDELKQTESRNQKTVSTTIIKGT